MQLVDHFEVGEDVLEEGLDHREGLGILKSNQGGDQVQVFSSQDAGSVLE